MMRTILLTITAILGGGLVLATEDPVAISSTGTELAGTEIRALPREVFIVSDQPKEAIKKFVSPRAIASNGFGVANDVSNGTTYLFETPERLFISGIVKNQGEGKMNFKDGDIIYRFYFDSPELKDRFCRAYTLLDKARKEGFHNIYSGKKGYYTQVLVKSGRKHVCSMHPYIKKDEPGTCPKCALEFVEIDNYE